MGRKSPAPEKSVARFSGISSSKIVRDSSFARGKVILYSGNLHTPAATTTGTVKGAADGSAKRLRRAKCRRRVSSTRGRHTWAVSRCRIKKCHKRFERL